MKPLLVGSLGSKRQGAAAPASAEYTFNAVEANSYMVTVSSTGGFHYDPASGAHSLTVTSFTTASPLAELSNGNDGDAYGYTCLMLEFDTSSIPDGATLTTPKFELQSSNSSIFDAAAVFEAYAFDWGSGAPVLADWQNPAAVTALLAANKRIATKSVSIGGAEWPLTSNILFTSEESNFIANINKTGVTRVLVVSAALRTNTVQTGFSYAPVGADSPNLPRLKVTY